MDPEQVYAEVLAEEQKKGSSGPVAEGRAKAGRARAEAGSPHPKEPKWWAGAQPHLEAAGAEAVEAEAAPAEEPEPEPAAGEAPAAATIETPVAEGPAQPAPQVAAEAQGAATAEEQAATRPPDQQPAAAPPPVPADQPPAAQPGQQPAVEPPAVATAPAPAEAAPPQRPAGVTHGTTTGTRLRPEDEVTTEAQFTGQEAMYQRRKLIDELVGTGVPAVAAEDTGRSGSPMMAVLYLIIPLIAIAFLVAQGGSGGGEAAPAGEEQAGGEAGGAGGLSITAESIQFNKDTLELPAGQPVTLAFENKDSVEHNVAIYETDEAEKELFVGEIFAGQDTMEYEVPALKKGEYYFQCDVHPSMNGDALVK